ncbi:MAG: PfkB family carbohydrate kinase [Kiritimatiellae bacterium]|nr:PfkB family carbohydrate kinase [Kiritimatiellia bacterium]
MNDLRSRPIDAVVAGYLGVDLTPGFSSTRTVVPFSELFRPGKLIETDGLNISLGGVVANTGLAMLKFGQRVQLMGCVGCDALGDLALARLAQTGATHRIRRSSRAGTAYGFVIAPPGMDRLFLEDAGCNRCFTADDIDYDVVGESRLFHFGYPPLMPSLWMNNGLELQTLLGRIRERNVAISLDMTLPDPESPAGKADWQSILAATLPLVDVFVPSIEEILFMLEPDSYARVLSETAGGDMIDAIPAEMYDRLADRILTMGVKVLLIKAGHRGAYLRTGNLASFNASVSFRWTDPVGCPNGVWIPPFPVDVDRFRNACGAGDCAVAAFLAALLNGESCRTAGSYAMLAGRDNLYGPDALSGLTEWSQMSDGIKELRKQPPRQA